MHADLVSIDQKELGAMPRLNPYAPRLSPTTVAPREFSQTSTSMEFLTNIEQIRIARTHRSARDGATLYEVQVYGLCPPTSNIPTVRNNGGRDVVVQMPTLSPLSPPVVTSRTSTATSFSSEQAPDRLPDFCVRRRFNDFARLRHEALKATCVNAHFLCQYCRQFQTYARFHAAQPIWIVHVVTTKKQRKRILARFLADLVGFAQSRTQRDRHCRLRTTLPMLIDKFASD